MNRELGKEITEDNKAEKGIYDLNEDGKIDLKDREILKDNYGKVAEEITWVSPNPVPFGDVDEKVQTLSLQNDVTIATEAGSNLTSNLSPLTYGTKSNISSLILPMSCTYTITSEYGTRTHPIEGEEKTHHGIDIVGTHHTEILAVADGEVTYAGVQNGYGNCVEIKHIVNGKTIYSFYAHLSEIDVKVGDKITKGQVIGLQGGGSGDPNPGNSTGEHLHFEIRTASGSGHSIDPTEYINF